MALIAVLVSSVSAATLPRAYAQTSYGTASLIVNLIDIGGGSKSFGDSEPIKPYAVTYNNYAQLKEIEFKVRVLLPSGNDKITNVLSTSPTLQLLKRDTTYANVAISGSPVVEKGPRTGEWYIYKGRVPISTIESLIGTGPEFKSELRIATKGSVTFQGSIADKKDHVFHTPQLTVVIPIIKNASTSVVVQDPITLPSTGNGDTGSGGNTQEPAVVVPTGRIYHNLAVIYETGLPRKAVSKDIQTFSVIDPVATGGNVVDKIVYDQILVLDNPGFALSQRLTHKSGGATDNYGASVSNQGVDSHPDTTIDPLGPQPQFQLIKMTVEAEDIEQLADEDGKIRLKFWTKEAYLKISSPTQSWTVTIPPQSVIVELKEFEDPVVIDETGGGQVNGGDFIPSEGAADSTFTFIAVGIGVMVMGTVTGVYVMQRKK